MEERWKISKNGKLNGKVEKSLLQPIGQLKSGKFGKIKATEKNLLVGENSYYTEALGRNISTKYASKSMYGFAYI